MGGWTRVLIGALVLGCSGDAGTRRLYRRTGVSYASTTVISGDLVDAAWNASCRFLRTGDGKLRCLPIAPEVDLLFLDDRCQQPAMAVPTRNDDSPFAIASSGGGCQRAADLYRHAGARTVPTFERLDGVCLPSAGGPRAVFPLERITGQAVEGSRVRGDARGGLAPIYLVAEGRQLWIDGWHAQDLDTDCEFGSDDPVEFLARTGGLMRCWPIDVTGDLGITFGDSGCVLPAVRESDETCGAPERFAVVSDRSRACPTRRTAFRLRGAVPTTFRRDAAGCLADTPISRALLLGEELPPERWPEGHLLVPEGPQRIRNAVIDTAVERIGTSNLWDDVLARFCAPALTGDGRTRCVPTETTFLFDELYADDACTRPLARAAGPEAGCTSGFVERLDPAGHAVLQLFRLGAQYHGPVFAMTIGGCAPAMHDADGALFELADEVPIDSLAVLDEATQ